MSDSALKPVEPKSRLALLPFSTFQEIARVLGADNVLNLLLARDKENYELIHR